MNDLIGRRLAIKEIMSEPTDIHYPAWYADIIRGLPSAEPEIKWIPVSERLPEDRRMVLVTFRGPDGKPWVRQGYFGAGLSEKWGYYDVIAWAEMPEPYKGDHSEQ